MMFQAGGIVCLIVIVVRIVFNMIDGNSSLPPKIKSSYPDRPARPFEEYWDLQLLLLGSEP